MVLGFIKIKIMEKEIKKPELTKEEEERLNSEFYWEQLQKIHSQNDQLTMQTIQEIRK
jgi:hypothetical protein